MSSFKAAYLYLALSHCLSTAVNAEATSLTVSSDHSQFRAEVAETEKSDVLEKQDFELFSFEGFRVSRYRSPTPESAEFAVTIDTNVLIDLIASEPDLLLLDVQPLLVREQQFIELEQRLQIPDSHWLPNVGLGELSVEQQEYLQQNLAQLTDGKLNKPMVVYCTADCWMSWNTIKRVSALGYNTLYWYRGGSDDWIANQQPTQIGQPILLQ